MKFRINLYNLRLAVIVFVFIPSFVLLSEFNQTNMDGDSPHYQLIPNSCTIFTVNYSNKVYFGNNEDYRLQGTYMWLIPSQNVVTPSGAITTYGSVGFGFNHNNDEADGYFQGGMNDQGLCLDANGLPVVSMNPNIGGDFPYYDVFMQILFECRNINEVIDWFLSHYLGSSWSCQVHFADATGDAMVVSVGVEGEFNFTRKYSSHYLVSTNFNLVNYANGWYPCNRYTTACSMLSAINSVVDLTVDACKDVLDAVHAEGTYATKYSNIFDPINKKIHLYYNHNFNHRVTLDLGEELARVLRGGVNVIERYGVFMKEIRIASLFTVDLIELGFSVIILISVSIILSLIIKYSKKRDSKKRDI